MLAQCLRTCVLECVQDAWYARPCQKPDYTGKAAMRKKVDAREGEGSPAIDWLDDVLPHDGPPMSEHLALEIEQAFTSGPLEPGEPVDGCTCGLCRIPDLPPYVDMDDVVDAA